MPWPVSKTALLLAKLVKLLAHNSHLRFDDGNDALYFYVKIHPKNYKGRKPNT